MKIILINDRSTDNSLEIIENFIKDYSTEIEIQVITLDVNSGPSKARNTGWQNANTEYIAFLDSDDSWHPQKLEIQYNYMLQNPEVKLSGHLMKLLEDKLALYSNIKYTNNDIITITPKKLIQKNYFTTTSNIMIKNDIVFKFDESMRYAEDYYLWLEICFNHSIKLINLQLGFAYKSFTGAGGLSGNVLSMYKGSLLVSKNLLKQKKISFLQYIIKISLRSLKFIIAIVKKYTLQKGKK